MLVMKKVIFLFGLLAMGSFVFVSCGNKEKKEDHTGNATEEEWPELESFHTIMAEMYHPMKDSGNLRPLKDRSTEFVTEVDKLANAKLPAKVHTQEVKAMITSLQSSIHGLDVAVKAGMNDVQVGELLEGVHTLFHHVQEEWYKRDHKE
jgi:hypothetical protein